jgi:hypothetical protein
MKKNLGGRDRAFRALAAAAMLVCSVMSPLPLVVRVAGFGAMGAYLLFTAVAGTCLGYRVLGKSTCPMETPR